MRKRRNPCSTASARPRRRNWVSGRGATADHAWRVPARACETANAGGERFCARSAARCRKSRTVSAHDNRVHTLTERACVAGLTDYEVRDLNDEINKLMREKRHWENQIVALGGANYRRNVAMLDDDGKEVPGTKGYK